MCPSTIIILAILTIREIDSTEIPISRETHLWLPLLPHPTAPVADESSPIRQLYSSPVKLRNFDPLNNRRYRRKKIHRWFDPVELKISRYPKRFRSMIPRIVRPVENWNNQLKDTKNLENSESPSLYLEPPKKTSENYRYYENNEISLENRAKEPIINSSREGPKNHRLEYENDEDMKNDKNRPIYSRDHAPEQQVEATDDRETNDDEDTSNLKSSDSPGMSKDRIEFHIHGHAGPETYMFGFDTGDGENRQYRMEERHGDGTVTGYYGYIDARGKLRKVQYNASPTHGYEEKHHETNLQEN